MSGMSDGVNLDFQMPSQSAAFRRTVAERMAAYQDRIAARIRRELAQKGEQPGDLAYKLGVNPRTAERWIAGESVPQPRHFRVMANHFGVKVTDLKPDLESEERLLAEQLDRIERKLDEILKRLPAEDETLALPDESPPVEESPPIEPATGEDESAEEDPAEQDEPPEQERRAAGPP